MQSADFEIYILYGYIHGYILMDSTNQESKNLSLGQVSFMDKVSQIFDMIRTSDNDQS